MLPNMFNHSPKLLLILIVSVALPLMSGCFGNRADASANRKRSGSRTTKVYAPPALPLGLELEEARVQSKHSQPVGLDLRGQSFPHTIPVNALPKGYIQIIVRTDDIDVHLRQDRNTFAPAHTSNEGGAAIYEFFVINNPNKSIPLYILKK